MKALTILTFLLVNSCIIYSQNFQEAGLFDPYVSGVSFTKSNIDYKIYQNSANTVKFDIPEASSVKIGIFSKSDNLVRTYIYSNLKAGTYEIKFTSGNLGKGAYTCVLNSGIHQESSKIIIE